MKQRKEQLLIVRPREGGRVAVHHEDIDDDDHHVIRIKGMMVVVITMFTKIVSVWKVGKLVGWKVGVNVCL